MDKFLRKHDYLLSVYCEGMSWNVQEEVCDRLKTSKEISQASPEGDIEDNDASNDDFANLAWLDDIVNHLHQNEAIISALPATELVSIFFLSNSNLVNALLPAPERCLSLLNTELPPFFTTYANSILEQLSSANRDISSACYTVEDFVLQLEAVSSVEDVYEHVDKEAVKIRKFYDFLAANDFIRSHASQSSQKSPSGVTRVRTVSTMLHSAFSDEDLLAQAITQEMQSISKAMHSCRAITDSQMAKFRNTQKDIDLKRIIGLTTAIVDSMSNPSLNSFETKPSDAVEIVEKISMDMADLRKDVEMYKHNEAVLIKTCTTRYLVDSSDSNSAGELKPRLFNEVDRAEEVKGGEERRLTTQFLAPLVCLSCTCVPKLYPPPLPAHSKPLWSSLPSSPLAPRRTLKQCRNFGRLQQERRRWK